MADKKQTRTAKKQPKAGIRFFAPFQNREEQISQWEDATSSLTSRQKYHINLYMGRMDSTQAEGYSNNSDQVWSEVIS